MMCCCLSTAQTIAMAAHLPPKHSVESPWMLNNRNPQKSEDPFSRTRMSHISGRSSGFVWALCTLEQAVAALEHMVQPQPSIQDFVSILHRCTKGRNRACALRLYAYMEKHSLDGHPLLGNYLVSLLAQVGDMVNAQGLFDRLPCRKDRTWNSLITGYLRCGDWHLALASYQKMQQDGCFNVSGYTFVALLKACSKLYDLETGQKLHDQITITGLLKTDVFIGSALVSMYAKCDFLAKAQEVFDKLPVRDLVSWTALISGYTDHGHGEEALKCFERMQLEGISPDAVTLVCGLKACASIGDFVRGQELHAEISRQGHLERDCLVGSALVDMYAKCGCLSKAQEVFNELRVRDVFSWTALIGGYTEHGRGEEALNHFKLMQSEGVPPDAATYLCCLKACCSIGAKDKALEIHAEVSKKGLETDLLLGSTLVGMYTEFGLLQKAQGVFDKLPCPDVVAWTTLISGYAEHDQCEEALNLFQQMQMKDISPNSVSFACALKACAHLGAIEKGKLIHDEVSQKGLLDGDVVVGTALVDMYAKCGKLSKAQEVFDKLLIRNEVSWNALIAGYSQLGHTEYAFCRFEKMIGENVKPTHSTFMIVLNACCHAGLVDRGQMYFEAISKDYGMIPSTEHHGCLADLLGRAGQLDQVVAMIRGMPFHPDIVVWHIVMGACRKWRNVELARQAFDHALQLDLRDPAAYICMSNVY